MRSAHQLADRHKLNPDDEAGVLGVNLQPGQAK